MHIIKLDTATLDMGRATLALYCAGRTCGDTSAIYFNAVQRETGMKVVPGAIIGCIQRGMNTADEILNAVARTSRCKRSTVSAILDGLNGDDPSQHLWRCVDDQFEVLPNCPDRGSGIRPLIATHRHQPLIFNNCGPPEQSGGLFYVRFPCFRSETPPLSTPRWLIACRANCKTC